MRGLCLLAFVAISLPALGQDAGFSSHLTQVTVPVVVRDVNGNAVTGLTKDDFQLLDRGTPQVISQFSVERATDSNATPGFAGAIQRLETPSRYMAYVFDDLSGEAADLNDARKAAEKHIDRTVRPEDRAAIFTTSGQQLCEFTADREKIHQALAALKMQSRRLLQDECVPIGYYIADQIVNRHDRDLTGTFAEQMQKCIGTNNMGPGGKPDLQQAINMLRSDATRALRVGDDQTTVVIHSLREVVRRLSRNDGERLMVLVSPGFYITDDFRPMEFDFIDQAVRANVKIGAVGSKGLIIQAGYDVTQNIPAQLAAASADADRASLMAGESTLAEFARGTGGQFLHNSNDLAAGMDRAARRPELSYVLAFSPANLQADGKYHELKVSFREGLPHAVDYTIEARRGYYAPGNRGGDPMEQVKTAIRSALYSRLEQKQIPVELNTQVTKLTRPEAGKSRLGVLAQVDVRGLDYSKSDGLNRDSLVIVAGVFDPAGKLIDSVQKGLELKLKDETLKANVASGVEIDAGFELKRGKYLVRFIVSDTEGQQMTTRNLPVTVQ